MKKESWLGLFSDLGGVGGVQASGRLAWTALADHARAGKVQMRGLSYGGGENGFNAPDVKFCRTKAGAILAARRLGKGPDAIVVWHLDLLKLLSVIPGRDARVLLFLHGIESWRAQSRWNRRLLKRVTTFLTNSRYTWERFLRVNPDYAPVPHQVVPLGILEPPGVVPPPKVPAAVMIGRLDSRENYKGHEEIVAAWDKVRERLPEAELWIVGGGDGRAAIESRAGKGIVFHGEVDETAKEDLLKKARCMLLPSRGEGFGLVYAEAMRLGRPCLVSGLDAGSEVVSPPLAGLAADPSDTDALTDAIVSLMEPGERWQEWSCNARRRYEENFTGKHFSDRLLRVLFE